MDPVISNRESSDVPLTIIIDTNRDTNGGIAKNMRTENGGAETTIVRGRFIDGATWFGGDCGTRRDSWYGGLSRRGNPHGVAEECETEYCQISNERRGVK
jgi:hypothetical protein